MKKALSLMLALVLVLGLSVPAMAAQEGGTITLEKVPVGETYNIYKMFDVTVGQVGSSWTYSYSLPENSAWEGFFAENGAGAQYFELDATTRNIIAKPALSGTTVGEFAKAALAYVKAEQVHPTYDPIKAVTDTITFTGLELGYYLIDTTAGTAVILDTNNGDIRITEKSASPNLKKEVQEDSTGIWGDSNTAEVGQVVNYRVVIDSVAGLRHVDLRDKMEGLTFDPSSVKVYKITLTEGAKIDDLLTDANLVQMDKKDEDTGMFPEIGKGLTWYLVDEKDASPDYGATHLGEEGNRDTFHVHFRDSFTASLNMGQALVVTYSATVNEDAKIGGKTSVGQDSDERFGNPNEAWLSYGDSQQVEHDEVLTYLWELPIFKYRSMAATGTDGNKVALAGAKFIVYTGPTPEKSAADSVDDQPTSTGYQYIKSIPTSSSESDQPAKAEYEWTANREEAYVFTSGEDGYIKLTGIDSNHRGRVYFVEEVQAPDGYNMLKEPVAVRINDNGTIQNSNSATITQLEIRNQTGAELPNTGGVGTTLFYIIGGAMAVAAAVLLVTKKRMSSEG